VVGESTYPVMMIVAESIDADVTPAQIFVSGKAGRVHKETIFSNRGNVPLIVGCFGALPLDDELAMCRIIRATLKNAPLKTETLNQWLTLYLQTAGKHLEQLGMLWVDTDGGPVTVQPGESASISLMIRIPELPPASRYVAPVKWYDTNFEIIIIPMDADVVPKEPVAVPNRATRGRRPK
jgi:hypothetical protein